MNTELMEKIGKLIDYACGWRNSFYRRYPINHYTTLIEYFDFRIDTRDMNAWMVSLDTLDGQQFFRIDKENFGLLVDFLEIPESHDLSEFLDLYPTTKELKIYNYNFIYRTNNQGYYFVTVDIEEG